jgi:DNA gyrase subunit A
MSAATGLGLLDLAILEACDAVGARSDSPFVISTRVLDAVWESTGIGRRTVYEPLCDMARPWMNHLALINFHGNYGSTEYGPASPRYTECRLTPLGAAALSAERGEIGPLPIGLINGDTNVDGKLPPLSPERVLRALRMAPGAPSADLATTVGLPEFPSGCSVTGDVEAFSSGAITELTLHARVTDLSPGQILVSHLPPGASVGEVANHLSNHPALIGAWNDTSIGDETNLVIRVARGASTDEVRRMLADLWGVRRTMTVQLGRPIADWIRTISDASPGDLPMRLDLIEAAASRQFGTM